MHFQWGIMEECLDYFAFLLGSPYTYVSLGKPIAPGQFSVDEVKSIFTIRK